MADDEKEMGAAYVPWGTFKRSLEDLLQGLPNQIDRSVWKGQSWGTQSQLISAFKFLGLIDDKGKPGEWLVTLSEMPDDEAGRKAVLEHVFKERYADLFNLDLTKATPEQVDKAMGNYRVSGETREKAVRFFLNGLLYLGIPVSKHLQPKAPNGGGSSRGKKRPRAKAKEVPAPTLPVTEPAGTSKVVNLRSGGILKISATLDLFSLSPTDRAFVFDLIDKLEDYEHLSTQADKEEEET